MEADTSDRRSGNRAAGLGVEWYMAMVIRSTLNRIAHWITRTRRPAIRDFEAAPDALRPTGDFADLFFGHDGRSCTKWFQYFTAYDREFGPYRDGFGEFGGHRPVRFLEIGVEGGGSLEIWRRYFGPEAVIFGIDIDERCLERAADDVEVRIGDQADPMFLQKVVQEMGGVDLVLDDGSHIAKHQRASFDTLFPLLSDGGVYVVEDTHTAYWAKHGGGLRRPGTFIEMAKSMVDGMHSWYFKTPVGRRAKMAQTHVESICFYDSLVSIRKRLHGRPVQLTRPVAHN